MPIAVDSTAIATLPAANRKKLHIHNDGPNDVAYSYSSADSLATIKADRALIPSGGGIILDAISGDICPPVYMACPAGTASIRYTEGR